MLVLARALLVDPEGRIEGGGLVLRGGRIERVLHSHGAARRAQSAHRGRVLELGSTVLCPGLVNAHAHLCLSALAGRANPAQGFIAWIQEVLRESAARAPAEMELAARAARERVLATGTSALGEIDSSGLSERVLAGGPLRLRLYRELLDGGDAARAPAALLRARAPFARRARTHPGLSPHAPHTTSERLLDGLRAGLRRRALAFSVHWAESEEERAWLAGRGGPFEALLGPAPRPGTSGLERLERAGLLGRRTSLVHANAVSAHERERVAARGATVVHCPGSHAFFGREPFPARAWLAAGVPLALGTDSLASNSDLDLRREMALLRAAARDLAPREVWGMATLGGARALGLEGRVGRLAPGFLADLAAFESDARSLADELELLTAGRPAVRGVCVGGAWSGLGEARADPTLVGGGA